MNDARLVPTLAETVTFTVVSNTLESAAAARHTSSVAADHDVVMQSLAAIDADAVSMPLPNDRPESESAL